MTPTTETPTPLRIWNSSHDEWCALDENDDTAICNCHQAIVASLRTRLEAVEGRVRSVASTVRLQPVGEILELRTYLDGVADAMLATLAREDA